MGIALLVLTLIVNTHSQWVKSALSGLYLAALVVGSCVVLWRWWEHLGKPGAPPFGQGTALPSKWRKWVLGEMDDDKKDNAKQ
jgi:hypothetical protein